MASYTAPAIPQAFIWRRAHSLTGLWLSIYLIFHLLTNSQAALFLGDDGRGFIHEVNAIHNLPFLPLIEIAFLAFPILVHMVWGIKYLRTSKINSLPGNGTKPSLPEYSRNRAYTWQRITSWILAVAIVAHIIHMRFIEYPTTATRGAEHYYMVRINHDEGLYTLAARLGVELYDKEQIQNVKQGVLNPSQKTPAMADTLHSFLLSFKDIFQKPREKETLNEKAIQRQATQESLQEKQWVEALKKRPLKEGQVLAVANNFGTAELLMIRDTFKEPLMIVLYTLFVLAACFHGFNGLWSFMIAWGVTLTERSQKLMLKISTVLMVLVAFMGLSAIWLTWINLKQ